ncbi:WD40-repeat-containing domain protein [Auriculariales sp. MPI-PUGE-AT-0066]|nr:WD40-repeat-containing domain protein [Auriculariales sp. MPI-PUGE-AT-0066]
MRHGLRPPSGVDVSAREINLLIYNHLMDSGFTHTAWVLGMEARLDTDVRRVAVKPGLLIELLVKALLYLEVDAHMDNNNFRQDCQAPFSLIKKHVCLFSNGRNAGGHDISVPPEPASRTPHPIAQGPASNSADTAALVKPVELGVIVQREPAPYNEPYTLLEGHSKNVLGLAWNPAQSRQNWLASTSADGTVRVWNSGPALSDGQSISAAHTLTPTGQIPALDGAEPLPGPSVLTLSWNRLGTILATGSNDGALRLYSFDPSKGAHLRFAVKSIRQSSILSVRFSPSGRHLLVVSNSGDPNLLDVGTKTWMRPFRTSVSIDRDDACCWEIDWLNDDTFLAASSDHGVNAYTLCNSLPFHMFHSHKDYINALAISPDKAYMASSDENGLVCVWDIHDLGIAAQSWTPEHTVDQIKTTNTAVAAFKAHQGQYVSLNWMPLQADKSQSILATGGEDGSARVWNALTGECIHKVVGHSARVNAVMFSQDGVFLASGSADGTLIVTATKSGGVVFNRRFTNESDGAPKDVLVLDWQRKGGELFLVAGTGEKLVLFDLQKLNLTLPS